MLSEQEKEKIVHLAKKFQVKRILLFGSNLDPNKQAYDIDLAVEGLPDKYFFKFYGELIFSLSRPVDLVDLNTNSSFNRFILEEGIAIYANA
jgi:uncharacterized protein